MNTRRVVLLSNHYYLSRRKAGFHWLAQAFRRAGWDVVFVTVVISPLSRLRGDYRLGLFDAAARNRLVRAPDGVGSFVWYTPFHPLHLRSGILNALSYPLFRTYGALPLSGLAGVLAGTDLLIFESNAALMLTARIRRRFPRIRLVYRASDDLRVLRTHPVIVDAERRALRHFDLVSVPTRSMLNSLAGPRTVWQSHGLNKTLFDDCAASPYAAGTRNAVFVGINDLDPQTVHTLAAAYPGWTFHVIGPPAPPGAPDNVRYYGETPFETTVAYVKHADIGLATRQWMPGAEVYSDSLKMVQYAYVRLPVVAPAFLQNKFGNVVPYAPGDRQSLIAAFRSAMDLDRLSIRSDLVRSWDELAREISTVAQLPGDTVSERDGAG